MGEGSFGKYEKMKTHQNSFLPIASIEKSRSLRSICSWLRLWCSFCVLGFILFAPELTSRLRSRKFWVNQFENEIRKLESKISKSARKMEASQNVVSGKWRTL
jgi:hypothetical protein